MALIRSIKYRIIDPINTKYRIIDQINTKSLIKSIQNTESKYDVNELRL